MIRRHFRQPRRPHHPRPNPHPNPSLCTNPGMCPQPHPHPPHPPRPHPHPPAPPPPPVRPTNRHDHGPRPYVTDITRATMQNTDYRTALWTGRHMQLTLMSIRPGEDIGLEIHTEDDQFLCIVEGQGIVQMGPSRGNLTFRQPVFANAAIFIPAGTWHNVTNIGRTPMKLYSIYAPPHHPHGTVHHTKAIAEKMGD